MRPDKEQLFGSQPHSKEFQDRINTLFTQYRTWFDSSTDQEKSWVGLIRIMYDDWKEEKLTHLEFAYLVEEVYLW